MQLLAVADTHGSPRFDEPLRARIESANPPDVFVHAGDWSDFGRGEEAMIEIFRNALARGIKVLYAPGNHDWGDQSVVHDAVPDAIDLHGRVVVVHGVVFYGLGFSLMPGQQIMSNLLHEVRGYNLPKAIQVTHEPPYGWPDCGRTMGDASVLTLIRELRPTMAICGHVHTPDGELRYMTIDRTLVVNPGNNGHMFTI